MSAESPMPEEAYRGPERRTADATILLSDLRYIEFRMRDLRDTLKATGVQNETLRELLEYFVLDTIKKWNKESVPGANTLNDFKEFVSEKFSEENLPSRFPDFTNADAVAEAIGGMFRDDNTQQISKEELDARR
jgi:hypothetical protein